MMKTGLILEGGAMRGLFSCGVLDVFLENGIAFDGMIGVSAGAAFGCNYKSRQTGRALRYNKRFCRDPRYCSFASWRQTGDLYGAEFCYHTLPEKLDVFDRETFERNPMDFYVVVTDVATGLPYYRKCEKADRETFEWIRASASMPLVSRPVELEGKLFLDGGIADAIPLRFFESIGYERNVAVLTRPSEYRKKSSLLPLFARPWLKKTPAMCRALAERHVRYNATLDAISEKERRGDLFVIRPDAPLPSGKIEHDPRRMQKTYDSGRETALRMLPALATYLCG